MRGDFESCFILWVFFYLLLNLVNSSPEFHLLLLNPLLRPRVFLQQCFQAGVCTGSRQGHRKQVTFLNHKFSECVKGLGLLR